MQDAKGDERCPPPQPGNPRPFGSLLQMAKPGALHFRVLQLAGVPKEMKTMRYSGHPLPMLVAPRLLTHIYIT